MVAANKARWTFSPVGEVTRPVPGDFILCHRTGVASTLIRLGERLRFRSGARWSHAALYLGDNTLSEVLIHGVTETPLEHYRDIEYVIVHTNLNYRDYSQVMAYADFESHRAHEYGWLTLLGVALRTLTPGRGVWFGGRANICSGYVAQAQTRGWALFEVNPASLTPAELAEHYGVPDRP